MTLVRKNTAPFLPSVFDELLNTDWVGGRTNSYVAKTTPAVNVLENEDSFTLEVAAPGLNKENFSIELDNDVLIISAELKNEETKEETKETRNFTRREFSYASFKRSFNLPETINVAEITAAYEQGILTVKLPKREEAKVQPSRMIEIS